MRRLGLWLTETEQTLRTKREMRMVNTLVGRSYKYAGEQVNTLNMGQDKGGADRREK